jgi:hypothetical protein
MSTCTDARARTHVHTHANASLSLFTAKGGVESHPTANLSSSAPNTLESLDWAELPLLTPPLRERVLFIGTQFSILYTSIYSPAEAATPRA